MTKAKLKVIFLLFLSWHSRIIITTFYDLMFVCLHGWSIYCTSLGRFQLSITFLVKFRPTTFQLVCGCTTKSLNAGFENKNNMDSKQSAWKLGSRQSLSSNLLLKNTSIYCNKLFKLLLLFLSAQTRSFFLPSSSPISPLFQLNSRTCASVRLQSLHTPFRVKRTRSHSWTSLLVPLSSPCLTPPKIARNLVWIDLTWGQAAIDLLLRSAPKAGQGQDKNYSKRMLEIWATSFLRKQKIRYQ